MPSMSPDPVILLPRHDFVRADAATDLNNLRQVAGHGDLLHRVLDGTVFHPETTGPGE